MDKIELSIGSFTRTTLGDLCRENNTHILGDNVSVPYRRPRTNAVGFFEYSSTEPSTDSIQQVTIPFITTERKTIQSIEQDILGTIKKETKTYSSLHEWYCKYTWSDSGGNYILFKDGILFFPSNAVKFFTDPSHTKYCLFVDPVRSPAFLDKNNLPDLTRIDFNKGEECFCRQKKRNLPDWF